LRSTTCWHRIDACVSTFRKSKRRLQSRQCDRVFAMPETLFGESYNQLSSLRSKHGKATGSEGRSGGTRVRSIRGMIDSCSGARRTWR
jgi:hypothetical protein